MWLLWTPILLSFVSKLLGGKFRDLPKSKYQPPGYVISIVWPILYLLMGYASQRVCCPVPQVYFVQLALNLMWPIFWGRAGPKAAFVIMLMLDVAVVWTYFEFLKRDKTAANLLLPYLAWISFATFLNWDIMKTTGK